MVVILPKAGMIWPRIRANRLNTEAEEFCQSDFTLALHAQFTAARVCKWLSVNSKVFMQRSKWIFLLVYFAEYAI